MPTTMKKKGRTTAGQQACMPQNSKAVLKAA